MTNHDSNYREWRNDELTGWWFMNVGDATKGENQCDDHRSWEDCQQFRFMIAGGVNDKGKDYAEEIRNLHDDYRLLAYTPMRSEGGGYVGAGIVLGDAVPQKDFEHPITHITMDEMIPHLITKPDSERYDDPKTCDWCVGIEWKTDVDRTQGVCSDLAHRGHTVCQIKPDRVHAIVKALGVDPDNFFGPLRSAA